MVMARREPFDLIYARAVREHLRSIERKYHPMIRATIEEQLAFEPDVETRNRKPLQRSITFEEAWEVRFGPDNRFRVFYEIDHEAHAVYILAVGVIAMVSDIEGVFLNVEPQNKEYRMSKENKYFNTRHSLFDIRYSKQRHHQG